MLSAKQFNFVDHRLQDIFHSDVPFGAVNVTLVGDFLQLRPIMATSIYTPSTHSAYSDRGEFCLRTEFLYRLFSVVRLTEILRQRDDVPYAAALTNMGRGCMTDDDIALFNSRTFSTVPDEFVSCSFDSSQPVRLFFRNGAVDLYNEEVMTNIDSEGFSCEAYNVVFGSATITQKQEVLSAANNLPTQDTNNLARSLTLKRGMVYMISCNVDTGDGLINGTVGTLKQIEYRESKQDGVVTKFPQAVWVYTSDSMAGRKARLREKGRNQASLAVSTDLNSRENDPANWTRISPRSETVYEARSKGLHVKRTQFPLLPAAALTIHKSQGSTYDKVLLDIRGQPRLNRDALYVACSRARHAENLNIIANSFPVPDPMPAQSDLYLELERQKRFEL
ncbi:hypothetical protein [Parasitella parasitica]|uniref:ATP-dependent DNA helicase n=1 Tax=Parasitella parasitica TaxID=35722 RepID=A0A0B7NWH7_9FUNG|nr:hypothetical protein [Parasitella parasitica]